MTPCSLVISCKFIEGKCCLHLSCATLKMEAPCFSEIWQLAAGLFVVTSDKTLPRESFSSRKHWVPSNKVRDQLQDAALI